MCFYIFLELTSVISVGKAPSPGSSAVSEKVRTRLEELDDLEEVGYFLGRHGHPQAWNNTPACVHTDIIVWKVW